MVLLSNIIEISIWKLSELSETCLKYDFVYNSFVTSNLADS